MKIAWSLVACCALSVAGCEKSSGQKASGPLGSSDVALLKDIPGGNVALMGGNYMKLQNFMQSQTAKMAMDMADKMGGGEALKKWMACFVEFKDLKLVGGLVVKGSGGFDMRMAFSGMTIKNMDDCAKKSGMEATVDPDGKYIAIQVPSLGTTVTQGYLQLKDGALYSRQSMQMGLIPTFEAVTRADLEADTSGSKGTAADDKKIVALAEKADRTQTLWFAGSGEGTPISDKVGDVYGSFNIENGMAADVVVQLKSTDDAKKIADGLDEAKKMIDQAPPSLRKMKPVLEGINIKRDGGTLRMMMKLSESDIAALMSFSKMGMGGGF